MKILDEFEQNIRKAREGHKVGDNVFYGMDGDLYAVSIALIEIIRTIEKRIEILEHAADIMQSKQVVYLEKRIENLERIAGTEEVEKE